jgi:predicted N-acyltransferase
VPCLHFDACYYQGIAYAIAHGLERFEGGAQGEHKLARGMEPVATASAHWISDPRFHDAVADYLQRERDGIDTYLDELAERLPFKRETP